MLLIEKAGNSITDEDGPTTTRHYHMNIAALSNTKVLHRIGLQRIRNDEKIS